MTWPKRLATAPTFSAPPPHPQLSPPSHSQTLAPIVAGVKMKVTKSRSGAASKTDAKLGVKKGGKPSKNAGKDPNKPKRPPSAFFVFMEEFRVEFKEKNPRNNAVSAVGKAAGAKWNAMSEADKAPYMAKAAKRKADYEKQMAAYNKKQAGGRDEAEDESDKSKSEVNDEEDGSGEEEDEE